MIKSSIYRVSHCFSLGRVLNKQSKRHPSIFASSRFSILMKQLYLIPFLFHWSFANCKWYLFSSYYRCFRYRGVQRVRETECKTLLKIVQAIRQGAVPKLPTRFSSTFSHILKIIEGIVNVTDDYLPIPISLNVNHFRVNKVVSNTRS